MDWHGRTDTAVCCLIGRLKAFLATPDGSEKDRWLESITDTLAKPGFVEIPMAEEATAVTAAVEEPPETEGEPSAE